MMLTYSTLSLLPQALQLGNGVPETVPLLTSNDNPLPDRAPRTSSFYQLRFYSHSMRRSFQIFHSVKPNRSIVLFLASTMLISLDLSSTVSMFKEKSSVRDRPIR